MSILIEIFSTVLNTIEFYGIQYRGISFLKIDTNHCWNLIFSFWWNENNTMEILDGWVQSGIWRMNLLGFPVWRILAMHESKNRPLLYILFDISINDTCYRLSIFQLWLHFFHLQTVVQKSSIQIFSRLYIRRFSFMHSKYP